MTQTKNGSNNKAGFSITTQPDVLKGVYSNLALIRHSENEFILDFILKFDGEANLVSRIIVSPQHAFALKEALNKNIMKYESKFGKISKTIERREIFHDDFEDDFKWANYGEGKVIKSEEQFHQGKFSLKKINRGDPNGGFRKFENPTHLDILFSGWIFRPSESSTSLGDRLAIEDNSYNGYGFCVNHKNNTAFIERRDKGISRSISSKNSLPTPIRDQWYKFLFYMKREGKFILKLFNEKKKLLQEIESNIDKGFGFFDRVVVHGGYPYYVDDLKIEPLEDISIQR